MRPWLIFGASGLLGRYLCETVVRRGNRLIAAVHAHALHHATADQRVCDLSVENAGADLVRRLSPETVIYAAGLTNVDACEDDHETSTRLHATAPAEITAATRETGGRFVLVSTDHLWRGDQANIGEDATPAPVNVYAHTKYQGERAVAAAMPDALIVRTNFFGWGPSWRPSISDWIFSRLRDGHPIDAFTDVYFTPIEASLLSSTICDLTDAGATGTFHAAGSDRVSKHHFALSLAQAFDLDASLVREASINDHRLGAIRPKDMSLSSGKTSAFLGRPAPSLRQSIAALKTTRDLFVPPKASMTLS